VIPAVLKRNIGLKILSVVIATLFYYVASTQLNPRVPRDMFLQPEVTNIPQDMVVTEPPRVVTITVNGLASTVNTLSTSQIRAVVDATSARSGLNRLPVTFALPQGVRMDSGATAPFAEVVLEKQQSQVYDVNPLFSGTPPFGYLYGDPVPQPTKVTVQGTNAQMNRVQRVVAYIERQDGEQAIERTVSLVAEDGQKRTVDGVEIKPSQVKVSIGLKRAPVTKRLLLSASIEGEPAPGYRFKTYLFTPQQIEVSGAPDVISSRSSVDIPVDIAGLRQTTTKTVPLTLPEGLRSTTGIKSVKLRIEVEEIPSVGTSASPSPAPPAASPNPGASPGANAGNP
jgi:YbbR domain-containing protein